MISATKLEFMVGTRDDGQQIFGDFIRTGSFISTGHVGSGHASFDEGAFVVGLLQMYSPSELKFAMVDPKRVQLTPYEGIPHLLRPIAYTPEASKELHLLLLEEVSNRHEVLKNAGVRSFCEYNQVNQEKLPAIVLLITEIADLMMVDKAFYEKTFVFLSQESKKVGIYLYIATQRPSTDILTDNLLESIPGRLVFEVSNKLDGERLLGGGVSAERLGGQGKLIYKDEATAATEARALYVSDDQISKIIANLSATRQAQNTLKSITARSNHKNRSVVGRVLGWIVLLVMVAGLVYSFANPGGSSCTINPFYGDDGCYDQYSN